MPKRARELKAIEVQRLSEAGRHWVGVVPGLCLQIQEPNAEKGSNRTAKTWILRVVVGGKRREIGLGGYPAVSLAQAHQKARELREQIASGIDPVAQKAAARSALKAAQASAVTFDEAARQYISDHEAGWRNVKHAQQWRATINSYASPLIGSMLVRDIEVAQVLEVLKPIWTEKTETASRLRSRIELILDWSKTRGYRQGLNPARWRGHLSTLLPKPSKIAKPKSHAALPVAEVGAFMKRLEGVEGSGAKALRFVILTAARSGEVRGARWGEINLEDKVWTVPAERMKAGKEHRVPLSDAALSLLQSIKPRAKPKADALVFVSPRGGPLSDMTLTAVLRRLAVPAVPHGFRSTFRDWCSERTSHPHEVAEMALAHTISNKSEAAYRRGDLFDKRRQLMADWAAFCAMPEPAGKVVPLKINRAARKSA